MISINDAIAGLQLSGIRQFTNLARQTPDCLLLTIGEPDFDTPEPIKDAAAAALQAGLTHYAPNQGDPALRTAIASYETQRGMPCTPEQVLVTMGATGALYTALLGILNPGDQVVIPQPAFPLYASITAIARAEAVPLDISRDGFQLTREALEKAITPKTKAIILNSPNNPSGTVYSRKSLEAVKESVLNRDMYVICDNVYDRLTDTPCPDLSTDPELRDKILLCQSFSKTYAMTGWRAGYLIGPDDLIARLVPLQAAQLAAVPTFVQKGCITALETDVSYMQQAYRRKREYVCRRLREMGLSFPKPEGAFYVFVDISRFGLSDTDFCTRLIREGKLATVPGSCFGAPGYLRISYALEEHSLVQAMDRLEQFLETQ